MLLLKKSVGSESGPLLSVAGALHMLNEHFLFMLQARS
eukprot:CAMPEP_0172675586 /NCGR_PEP_ID=MMETSP1074-20121228/13359_1 /TAXON_ID=2916 /ORGANISM="Ceratium fusus, Strain PA161109" /LENGTH=37 /DNA_ID= /DNA_START= /DNA_END= /DNA_ORIENTATION=